MDVKGWGQELMLDLFCLLESEPEAGKMSTLEKHLEGIINIFHQCSIRVGNYDTLSKSELKKLITRELANTIKVGDAHLVTNLSSPCTEGVASSGRGWWDKDWGGVSSSLSSQGPSPPALG